MAYQTLDLVDAIELGLPVFTGIQRQMTERGGFSTTQDTVIGIQAMAVYAAVFSNENTDITISLEAINADGSTESVGQDKSYTVLKIIENFNLK